MAMTRKEFQEKVNELVGYEYSGWGRNAKKTPKTHLEKEWRCGGMSGGSCWGDSADYPIDSDPEPDFEELDTLLEELAPDITFLQYKTLSKLIEDDSRCESEYYGNYSNYSIKRIPLDALYLWLKEKNFI